SPGPYGMRVREGAEVITNASAFTVEAGGQHNLMTEVISPGAARFGREFQAVVVVTNKGNLDVSAPLVSFTSTPSVPIRMLNGFTSTSGAIEFVVTSSTGPDQVIRPGQVETVVVYLAAPQSVLPAQSVSVSSTASENSGQLLMCAHLSYCHDDNREGLV